MKLLRRKELRKETTSISLLESFMDVSMEMWINFIENAAQARLLNESTWRRKDIICFTEEAEF